MTQEILPTLYLQEVLEALDSGADALRNCGRFKAADTLRVIAKRIQTGDSLDFKTIEECVGEVFARSKAAVVLVQSDGVMGPQYCVRMSGPAVSVLGLLDMAVEHHGRFRSKFQLQAEQVDAEEGG